MRKNKVPRFIFLRSKSSLPIRKKLKKRISFIEHPSPEEPHQNVIKNNIKKKTKKQEQFTEKEEKRIHRLFFKSPNKNNIKKKTKKQEQLIEKEEKRIQNVSFKSSNKKNPIKKKNNQEKQKKKEIIEEPIKKRKRWKNKKINRIKNKKSDDAHVVIAHYNEDTKWISKLKYNHTLISRYNLPKETPPNKGNEASSYLEYIIKNYHQLKEYTIFVHGHETAYHHPTPIHKKINNMIFDKLYYNINELAVHTHVRCHNDHMKIIEEKIVKRTIQDSHLLRPCAMFYVHRDLILRNPLEVYIEFYDYIMNSNEESYYLGRYFEFTWHIIFTHQDDDTL